MNFPDQLSELETKYVAQYRAVTAGEKDTPRLRYMCLHVADMAAALGNTVLDVRTRLEPFVTLAVQMQGDESEFLQDAARHLQQAQNMLDVVEDLANLANVRLGQYES